MPSASSGLRWPHLSAAIASTAFLLWLGNGLNPVWALMWFAPLPILMVSLGCSWPLVASSAFVAWLLGSLSLWHYFVAVLHVPAAAWVAIFGIQALLFAIAVLLFRVLLLKGRTWVALFAFPAAWVSIEFINNLASPHGTAGNLAYTQLKLLPILQLASITGPWGISFSLLLFPTAIAIGFHLGKSQLRQALVVAASGLSLIALAMIFGTVRLHTGVVNSRLRVALIASDGTGIAQGDASRQVFSDYAAQVRALARNGAEAIVLPEKIGVVTDADRKQIDSLLQSVANDAKAPLIVGMVSATSEDTYNQARIYVPATSPYTYNKQHMLPPFESDLKPGTSLTLLDEKSGKWGVAICKDMDFRRPAADYGRSGVGLLLVPAWDFHLDRSWHGHMAIMRGVESGYSIARAARNGFLTVSDNRGRILAEKASGSSEFAVLLTEVPVGQQPTIYLWAGDWFAWLSIAITAIALLRILWR